MLTSRCTGGKIRTTVNKQLIFPVDDPLPVSQHRHTARFPPRTSRTTLHMKKTYILAALLLSSISAYSQTPVDGTISTFNIALTISTEGPGTVVKDSETGKPVKDEETNKPIPAYNTSYVITKGTGDKAKSTQTVESASKIFASKYSTKELLEDLVEIEVIPEVKNWSIKKVQATTEGGNNISPASFFAVNKEGDIVPLDGIIGLGSSLKLSGLNLKTVTTDFDTEDSATKTTYTEALKFVGGFYIALDEDAGFDLTGVLTTSQKLGFTKGAEKRQVIVSGAGKFSSLTGTLFEESIVEGSASLSAGAIADVSAFIAD